MVANRDKKDRRRKLSNLQEFAPASKQKDKETDVALLLTADV